MVLQEGDRFPDFKAFKTAMQDWGLKGQIKFNFRYQKSDSTRKIVVCAHTGCPFRVYAVLSGNKEYVSVATIVDEHNCVGAPPAKRGLATQQWWLQEILPTVITVTKTTTPKQIIDAMALHHQVAISYQAAKKAKSFVLGDDIQQQGNQFRLLPAYIDAVRKADPHAHVHLQTGIHEGVQRFQRLFICPEVSAESFRHCRYLLAVDGTFTKEIFNLTILMAASVDADNHAVLLAWAIVEGESEDSWRYFLGHLVTTIPQINHPSTTIISDRDKGIDAADDRVPRAHRAYCLEHISRNLQTNFGLPSRTTFNAEIRFALTETKLRAGFDKLATVSPQALDYLRNINMSMWATPHLAGKRYGHNTSKLVEIMNSWIVEERKLSIIDLLHSLWSKNMDLWFRHRQEAEKYAPQTPLTKYSTTLLAQSMEFSNHRVVRMADEFRGSVLSFRGKWYAVDLQQRTCSCGRFQYNDVPCGHAIAVIQGFHVAANEGPQRSARDFVSFNLTVAALKGTYARVIPPVDITDLQPQEEFPCQPPRFRKPRGRPQTKCLTAGEMRARTAAWRGSLQNVPNRIQHCSRCKQEGHNVARCWALPEGM